MPNPNASSQQTLRVYDVRLVQARRPLKLAESVLDNPGAAARVLHSLIGLTDREHFAILFLNGGSRITGAHIAAVGAQHMIGAIDPRAIFRAALAACASAVIVGHNHPSGNPSPSADDLESTEHLMRAGALLGVPVVDHVIVTPIPGREYSMFQQGTLPAVT